MEALLHRCILRNCTYSLQVPTSSSNEGGAAEAQDGVRLPEEIAGYTKSRSLKPTLIYDTAQIFSDVEDEFLKNRALISYRVGIDFFILVLVEGLNFIYSMYPF